MAGRAAVIPKKSNAEPAPMEEQISQPTDVTLEDRIRQRAHAIYLERGARDGSDVDDWLQAEQEIASEGNPGLSGNPE